MSSRDWRLTRTRLYAYLLGVFCFFWSFAGGIHLWLAIEIRNQLWPREEEVQVGNGKWQKNIFQDGPDERFSISLLAADTEGDKRIRGWIKTSVETGHFIGMRTIPEGVERLARIDNLKLVRK